MTEEFLDRADVATFEQVRGKQVAKCVVAHPLSQTLSDRPPSPLHRRLVQVKPGGRTKPFIPADPRGRNIEAMRLTEIGNSSR
jgi:hypothetical protein